MRKYKLKCFGCGYKFKDKTEVWRNDHGDPVCGDCITEDYQEPPRGRDPTPEDDQNMINEYLLHKYGEF